MTSSESPEKSGKEPAVSPTGASFWELLDWHLRWGTRPGGLPGRRGREWNNKAFADAVGVNERSVRNWRTGRSRPNLFLERVLEVLFAEKPEFESWRDGLRTAFQLDDSRVAVFFPHSPAYFLGRDEELEGMRDTLRTRDGGCSILVQGGPGIGKTALTIAFGAEPELLARVGDVRRWFVRAETLRSNRALQLEIARTLGVGSTQPFPGCLAKLSEEPALLVIDNLETAWEEVAERRQVEATLAELAALGTVVLVVSIRGADRVGGPPWALVQPVGPLSQSLSNDLFRRIAPNVAADDPYLAQFTEALGGVPLAIELVASRAWTADNLADLWAEWRKVGTRLAARPDFRRTRKTSLDRSIELSLRSRRVNPATLRLFAYLGQLPAGLAAADRDGLMGDEGFEASERLCRVGLAFRKGPRLQVLPPIRDYAARHYPPAKRAALKWPRYYLDLTRDLGGQLGMAGDAGIYRRLRQELPNVQAAFAEYLKRKSLGKPLGALSGLFRIATLSGTEMPVVANIAAACLDRTKVSWQGTCMHTVACIAMARGDDATAEAAFEAALDLYRLGGFERGVAVALDGLGDVYRHRGDIDEAEACYNEALEITLKLKPEGSPYCFRSLGLVKADQGDTKGALANYERALKLDIHAHDRLGQASSISLIANIHNHCREFGPARVKLAEAIKIYEELDYGSGLAQAYLQRAHLEKHAGQEESARRSVERALAIYREEEDLSGQGDCYEFFASIAELRHDPVLCAEHTQIAQELYRHAGDVRGDADCQLRLAKLAHETGDYTRAEVLYRDAIALSCRLKRRYETAESFGNLGYVLVGLGQTELAREAFTEARSLFETLGEPKLSEHCATALAGLDMPSMPPPGTTIQ